jgi:hypothetical protein
MTRADERTKDSTGNEIRNRVKVRLDPTYYCVYGLLGSQQNLILAVRLL